MKTIAKLMALCMLLGTLAIAQEPAPKTDAQAPAAPAAAPDASKPADTKKKEKKTKKEKKAKKDDAAAPAPAKN